jgi:hypothetical protein
VVCSSPSIIAYQVTERKTWKKVAAFSKKEQLQAAAHFFFELFHDFLFQSGDVGLGDA